MKVFVKANTDFVFGFLLLSEHVGGDIWHPLQIEPCY